MFARKQSSVPLRVLSSTNIAAAMRIRENEEILCILFFLTVFLRYVSPALIV